jgi:hypothetical protein
MKKRILMEVFRVVSVVMALLIMVACGGAAETDIPDNANEYYTYCAEHEEQELPVPPSTGHIHLYGERHGLEHMTNKHFESWYYYYTVHGFRHLILESSFFTAEFLNIWMQEDDDDILDAIFRDLRGTPGGTVYSREFFHRIKRELPETIFHGVDIGHQHNTTGQRFLRHLRDNGLEGSELYLLTAENIAQGLEFYGVQRVDHNWRTVVMANNFIRVFDSLDGESVMGQFGGFHVNTPES